MSQMTFGDAEYAGKRKKTRREVFLEEMDQVVPWKSLLNLIEPCYPIAGRGRHPYPLDTMLRVHLMQNWFGLSDPAMEEALYEITPMRTFAGLTLTKAIPDETTILNFRHLLEEYELAPEILQRVNGHLARKGLLLKRGSIVDATIIAAPSSTKNAQGERDPEMHQAKKGQQWHFGMKAHIGVDADSGLVHTVTTTPANTADVEVVEELLHGKEEVVHADSGYTGAQKRVERRNLTWRIAAKRGRIKAMADGREKRRLERIEKAKASVRAKVEHPFRTIGAGSLGHLVMAQLGNQLGVEFNHIPYRGGGPLMNDAIASQVPLAIGSVFLVKPHVDSGRLRAIAVTSLKPDPKLPGAEPIASQGVPGFEAHTWWGVYAPGNMPPALARRIYDELAKAVSTPAVKDKLSGQGIDVAGAPGSELDVFVRKEIARWARVVKDNNIKAGD